MTESDEVLRERDQCIRDVCMWCRMGLEPQQTHMDVWVHEIAAPPHMTKPLIQECVTSRIRMRTAKAERL